jgi:hypothetical protein
LLSLPVTISSLLIYVTSPDVMADSFVYVGFGPVETGTKRDV